METTNEPMIENTDSESSASTYFTVSVTKFTIMSLCTMGIYELYWFYKNWGHIKSQQKNEIMPFWRAFFAPLWAYSAFKHIQDEINEKELNISIYAGALAVVYLIFHALWRLPDPYWFVSYFTFLFLIPANNALTLINQKEDSSFQQNSAIKGWNWLAVTLGGVVFILSIIGTFLPETA